MSMDCLFVCPKFLAELFRAQCSQRSDHRRFRNRMTLTEPFRHSRGSGDGGLGYALRHFVSQTDTCFDLSQVMHVLPEHFGCDQRHAAVGDEETLSVLGWIDAGFEPCRKGAVSVDDAV